MYTNKKSDFENSLFVGVIRRANQKISVAIILRPGSHARYASQSSRSAEISPSPISSDSCEVIEGRSMD